jgi:sugar (pentulose or hexulose) kinase
MAKPSFAPPLLLGVDIGTTRTKAGVVSADGRELAWGSVETPWRMVPTGAEMRAEDLLGAVLRAAATALEAAPPGPVTGLGVTSMAETAVWLDASGRPCGPCIAWYDGRGAGEALQLGSVFGKEAFSQRTGLPVSAMCTLVKLAWLSHQGGVVPLRALSVADWVVHALGGDQIAEASLASRTGAFDVPGRCWWDEAVRWAGAGRSVFAPVVQAGQFAGKVSLEEVKSVAAPAVAGGALVVLDRLEGAALASAGHDHLSAAVGTGAVANEQVLDSCGTAESLVRAVAPLGGQALGRAVAAGLEAGWHTVPGRNALVAGSTLGMLLERVLKLLGKTGPGQLEDLDARATGVPTGTLRVVSGGFFGDPYVQGVHAAVSPEALWSAALDEVASVAAKALEAIQDFAGPAEELLLSGGWARCNGLRRRKAGLLARARWPAVSEAGARGAALFGGCAAGLFEGPAGFPAPQDRPLGPSGVAAATPADAQ